MTDEPIVGGFSVDVEELDREGWKEAVQDALARISQATSSSEKVVLRQQIASVYELHMNAPDAAFAQLVQAFVENPMNKQTVENIERLADNLDKWQELVSIATTALNAAPGKHAQVQLCLKIGDWCSEKLEQLDQAFGFYRSAIERKPNHIKAYLRLAGLYRKTEQWSDLAELLAVAAVNCEDKERAGDFLYERGVIYEKHLNAPDIACQAFEQALEFDPQYIPVLGKLEQIYREREDWWPLISVLRRKLDLSEDAETTMNLHFQIGEILAESLGDTEGAADNYKKVLNLDPSHLESLAALQRIYEKLDKKTRAKEVLEKRLECTLEEGDRIPLMEQLATMLADQFSELEKAAEIWEKLLETDPDHAGAREELEKIYKRKLKWPKLALLIENKLEQAEDDQEKVVLGLELGQIQGNHLGEWDRARLTFEQVLELESRHPAALDGLGKALEALELWQEALDVLTKLLDYLKTSEEEKEILFRVGTILYSKQEDLVLACDYFKRILAIDKDNFPALRALSNVYIDLEQWTDAAEILQYEHGITESRTGKAKLCFKLGWLYDKLSDRDAKQGWYEKALKHDPYNPPAAEALAALYQEDDRHEDAEPLLEMLIRLGGDRDDQEKHDLYHRLSVTKDALGKTEEHLQVARKAKEYGSADSKYETLSELVSAALKNEKYHEAVESCRLIIKEHLERLSAVQQSELYYCLGFAHFKISNKLKAHRYLTRSLEMDASNENSLNSLIELSLKQKKYKEVARYKNDLGLLLEGEERYTTFVELGDYCQNRLTDNSFAIDAFKHALEVKPKDRPVLHKILAVYQEVELWEQVIETIETIRATEDDPIRLSRLYYSLGVVWRDKMDQPAKALDSFNLALDSNPDDEETFRVATAIVAKDKDWHELVRNYQWMLDRLEGRGNLSFEAKLHHALGEVYLYRMENYPAAALSFGSAISVDKKNIEHHDRLASAYFRMEDHAKDAIDKYRQLIKLAPNNVKYYKRLGGLLNSDGRHDEAWCVSSALVFMGQASGEEQAFYERYRAKGYPAAQRALPADLWSKALSHPFESENIAEIFSIVGPAIAEKGVKNLKAFGLHKKDIVNRQNSEQLDKIAHYVTGTFGIHPMPELYIKKDDVSAFVTILTKNPASFCGDRFLQGKSQDDILFFLTKHLTYYRRGRRIRWIIPTTAELRAVLGAAVKFGDKSYKLSGTKTQVIFHYVDVLQELLGPNRLQQLKEVAERFAAREESSSVKRWLEGLELTAGRAALLILGDLVKVAPMVRSERALPSGPTLKRKIHDLLLFSISKEYSELRRSLGIAIDYKD